MSLAGRAKVLKVRLERAGQLFASGEWSELGARLKRKVTPKGDPPEAMDDPHAYARWLGKQRRRFERERRRADTGGAEDLRTLIVEDGMTWPEPRPGNGTLFMRGGDVLEPGAERLFAAAFARGADVVTCDDDRIDSRGRRVSPRFKPMRWSPERLLEDPYVLPGFLARDSLLEDFVPPAGATAEAILYAVALHLRVKVRRSEHLPLPLMHARRPFELGPRRARLTVPQDALTTIMIPFRDRPELLSRCLTSLFAHTGSGTSERFEVVLLDNGSREPATRALLARWRGERNVRVLELPGVFNFAALNNAGAKAAAGTHLLLLNNDTEILERGWLDELVGWASLPDVGAVGCRLLYPDRTLQHAGVWLGVAGLAAHAYIGAPAEHAGHAGELRAARNLSAVTGACLMIEKKKWQLVSGMDERRYAVAFNDLDLCLRLEASGLRTVYTPHAVVMHHESKSRGSRVDMREERAFMHAHAEAIASDPYYNVNLSRLVPDGRWR